MTVLSCVGRNLSIPVSGASVMNMTEQKLYLMGHRESVFVPRHDRNAGIEPIEQPIDYHKIGISDDPERRLSHLSGGTPHDLELITTVDVDSAEDIEDRLHAMNHALHKQGEWFRLSTNMVNSLRAFDHLAAENIEAVYKDTEYSPGVSDKSLYVRVMEERKR